MQQKKPSFFLVLAHALAILFAVLLAFFVLFNMPDSFWRIWTSTFQCLSLSYVNIPFCELEIYINDIKTASGFLTRSYGTMSLIGSIVVFIIYRLIRYDVK